MGEGKSFEELHREIHELEAGNMRLAVENFGLLAERVARLEEAEIKRKYAEALAIEILEDREPLDIEGCFEIGERAARKLWAGLFGD